jgi:23S rRNA (cytidine1920-2'-O)/16S rRNA (cytidine1409-2'-O)-methyltransferase
MARRRVDAELVRRGNARSRTHAAELIANGRVAVDGRVVAKPATQVDPAQALVVAPAPDGQEEYASRGGHKLAGALDAMDDAAPPIAGAVALDAGASTGGFTDVLLRRGAAHVTAVDVGYGQLAWRLRTDPRVSVLDRTNVRLLSPGDIDPPPSVVVADLSFISLTAVLAALAGVAAADSHFLLMVKPQFEVGKDALPSGGVVRDRDQRAGAVAKVAGCARELGLHLHGVFRSPLPGPSGNVEFFVYLNRDPRNALIGQEAANAIVREVERDEGVAA